MLKKIGLFTIIFICLVSCVTFADVREDDIERVYNYSIMEVNPNNQMIE